MSIEALNWALTQMQRDDMSTSTRFVLMILANRSDPEGVCWPSQQYIQDRTGLSTETVRSACKKLQEFGLLEIEPRLLENGRRTSNHYQLTISPPTPQPLGGTTPKPLGGDPPTIGGKTKEVDKRGLTPLLETEGKEKGQGQNRPAGPACAHCDGPLTTGHTSLRIGNVCNPCYQAYLRSEWKIEERAA